MAKKDPEKIIKDLQDYRIDGDGQRVLDEIDSFMEELTQRRRGVTAKADCPR